MKGYNLNKFGFHFYCFYFDILPDKTSDNIFDNSRRKSQFDLKESVKLSLTPLLNITLLPKILTKVC